MGIIGSIRKHSWIAVTIVGIAIIAFIIGDLTKRNGGQDQDVADVNGKTLKMSQFSKTVEEEVNYSKTLRAYTTGDATLTSDEENAIRDSIWANYLNDIVLDEQFEKLGLEVSEAEMNDMATGTFIHPFFANNPQLYENGQYSRTRASSMIKANNNTKDPLQRMYWEKQMDIVKKDRLLQKYVTLLTSGFYMPKPLAQHIASYSAKGVTASVVRMPLSQVADNELNLTPSDYQKYYNTHKEEFRNQNEEMRVLEYVTFEIVPNADDHQAAKDSAMVVWNRLQDISDNTSRTLDIMARKYSKDYAKYSYDSVYNRYLPASYFAEPFSEKLVTTEVGKDIEPVLVDNKWWFMGRLMGIENRPDSIRTSVLFVSARNQRDTARTAFLADSLMTELRAGRLDFDSAIVKYSAFPTFRLSENDSIGDMNWQKEGFLDNVFENYFNARGNEPVFTGINDQIVKAEGDLTSFALPNNAGYVIVKVTGKSAPVKKYNLALMVQKIKASDKTTKEVQDMASKFLSESNNGKDFDKAKGNRMSNTIQVYRTNNRVVLGQTNLNGVIMNNYLNNLGDVVKWAFNENTKVGDVTMDAKLDRSLEPSYGVRNKKTNKENSVDVIAVVRLKDVFKPGYLTLDQVRALPEFNFEQNVRNEKRKEILMARAEKIAKSCKNIQDVASVLGDTVAVIDSINVFSPKFGGFGLERKVQSLVASSKSNGLLAPIKGANGIYFVQVDNNYALQQQIDPEQVRMGLEGNVRMMYGTYESLYRTGNEFSADWNVIRYLTRFMIYTGNDAQPYQPLFRECRLTQWLRANAKVEDHRE